MTKRSSRMGIERLYSAFSCAKPHFSPSHIESKPKHSQTAYTLYMQPLKKGHPIEHINSAFMLSPANRLLAKDKLFKSISEVTDNKDTINYQVFNQILLKLSLVSKATSENTLLKLWSELNQKKKKEIALSVLLDFLKKLLSLDEKNGKEESSIRKEYSSLLSCYMSKDIGKTRNTDKQAFSFSPLISKKSMELAQFKKNSMAFSSYAKANQCRSKVIEKPRPQTRAYACN